MASKDVLKEAIKAFDGTAIIVSHDREFLDGLVTKVYEFGGGKVREHLGGIYDFLQAKKISELSELGRSQVETKSSQVVPSQFPPREQTVPAVGTDSSLQGNFEGTISKVLSYAERKEQQKRRNRAEKAVKDSETKIEKMEQRLKELDDLLMIPENASDMTLVTEYTSTKKCLDEEVERWEQLSEELEKIISN
jgi:ATP-binding cassette subfamily F protein 3